MNYLNSKKAKKVKDHAKTGIKELPNLKNVFLECTILSLQEFQQHSDNYGSWKSSLMNSFTDDKFHAYAIYKQQRKS